METASEVLCAKFETREARVAIIGLGYVGLPLALAFTSRGFSVTGIDTDGERVRRVQEGQSYVTDVSSQDLGDAVASGRLSATHEYDCLGEADAISICVPTPLRKTKDPDISYIIDAAEQVSERLHKGQLIVLESTTYPGTTEEVILPRLSSNGLQVGQDFFLAFSPERVDPGNRVYSTTNTPKVVGGVTSTCTQVVQCLYEKIINEVVSVSSTQSAEMVKLLENTFRSVNIGLVNEIAIMCNKLGIDVWEVIHAAATKPFGFMPFFPGPGLGGHCIPIDPCYLSWKLKTLDYKARFIELAGEINSYMPQFVVEKVVDGLNDFGKSVRGSQILIVGLAYKPDITDVRESPALDIARLLQIKGACLSYHDPYVPAFEMQGEEWLSIPLTPESVREMDCVVLVTHHTGLDYGMIGECAPLIVDTRNAMKGVSAKGRLIPL